MHALCHIADADGAGAGSTTASACLAVAWLCRPSGPSLHSSSSRSRSHSCSSQSRSSSCPPQPAAVSSLCATQDFRVAPWARVGATWCVWFVFGSKCSTCLCSLHCMFGSSSSCLFPAALFFPFCAGICNCFKRAVPFAADATQAIWQVLSTCQTHTWVARPIHCVNDGYAYAYHDVSTIVIMMSRREADQ